MSDLYLYIFIAIGLVLSGCIIMAMRRYVKKPLPFIGTALILTAAGFWLYKAIINSGIFAADLIPIMAVFFAATAALFVYFAIKTGREQKRLEKAARANRRRRADATRTDRTAGY